MTIIDIVASASGALSGIAVINQYLTKAKHLIPDTVWELAVYLFKRQPIRAQQHAQGEPLMTSLLNISHLKQFTEDLEHYAGRIEAGAVKISKAVVALEPVVKALAPLAGSAAPEVAAGAEVAEVIAEAIIEADAQKQPVITAGHV